MKVALFVGNHRRDTLLVRAGWGLTRLAQKGSFGAVTHVEAIHAEYEDGSVRIASASLREGGVRQKRAHLEPTHWLIADVPQWGVDHSIDFLQYTEGRPYDWRGALATMLPGTQQASRWFCNEWVGAPFLRESATFCPSQFAAVCVSLGRDITSGFFADRPTGPQHPL